MIPALAGLSLRLGLISTIGLLPAAAAIALSDSWIDAPVIDCTVQLCSKVVIVAAVTKC
jgi:hypothetical protein